MKPMLTPSSPRLRAASPAAAASDDSNPYKKTYPASLRQRRPAPQGSPQPCKESDLWATGIYSCSAERVLRTIIGPVLLLLATPIFVNVAALAAKEHDSDVLAATGRSIFEVASDAFPLPSIDVVVAFAGFIAFQLALFVLLPGKIYPGALAPSGFVPQVRRSCSVARACPDE